MDLVSQGWDWMEMCGAGGFVVWSPQHHDLGVCFQLLCLHVPSLTLLALLSAYLSGQRSYWVPIAHRRHAWVLVARGIATFFLSVAPILKICFAMAIAPRFLNPVDYLTAAVETLAWLVHLCYVLTLKNRIRCTLRGPVAMCVLWMLTFALAVVSTRSHYLVYVNNTDTALTLFVSQCYGFSILTMVLQVVYLVTMIPTNSSTLDAEDEQIRIQVSEAQALLAGCSRPGTYSRFREDEDPQYLGVAKESAPLLSRLLLHWVTPLMRKGMARRLAGPDELYDLPLEMSPAHLGAGLDSAMDLETSATEMRKLA